MHCCSGAAETIQVSLYACHLCTFGLLAWTSASASGLTKAMSAQGVDDKITRRQLQLRRRWKGRSAPTGPPKMMTATSTEQRTPSSYAFLKSPFFRCNQGVASEPVL